MLSSLWDPSLARGSALLLTLVGECIFGRSIAIAGAAAIEPALRC